MKFISIKNAELEEMQISRVDYYQHVHDAMVEFLREPDADTFVVRGVEASAEAISNLADEIAWFRAGCPEPEMEEFDYGSPEGDIPSSDFF